MTGVHKKIWSRWLALGEKIGDLVMLCVLTVSYFVLFLIPSLYFTWGADTVGKQYRDGSYFEEMPDRDDTPREAEEMA
jgi:predicted alpha/beta hydrolase